MASYSSWDYIFGEIDHLHRLSSYKLFELSYEVVKNFVINNLKLADYDELKIRAELLLPLLRERVRDNHECSGGRNCDSWKLANFFRVEIRRDDKSEIYLKSLFDEINILLGMRVISERIRSVIVCTAKTGELLRLLRMLIQHVANIMAFDRFKLIPNVYHRASLNREQN